MEPEKYLNHLWCIRYNGKFANFYADTGEKIPDEEKQAAMSFCLNQGYVLSSGDEFFLSRKGILRLYGK
jgi:hypothetical protein